MNGRTQREKGLPRFRRGALLCLLFVFSLCLSACSGSSAAGSPGEAGGDALDTSRWLVAVDDEPDTLDFQCTNLYYTVALTCFNRLAETERQPDGSVAIVPSLAESWRISSDGMTYIFKLREGVRFSNGSALTAEDVLYTMTRMLTLPEACNRDLYRPIMGSVGLENGSSSWLRGFYVINDLEFILELNRPFEAFLASLSTPGASILDKESCEEAGERFGRDPAWTIGTGPFVLRRWEPGHGMLLSANADCWQGAPACEGLDLRFVTDAEAQCLMFERGELDILQLDDLGNLAEYFTHGDIYQDRLVRARQVGIDYIALNASIPPLDDARVRKALQLGLNRQTLLDAVYSGLGTLENGIFPHGLKGHNPDLPEIPYDPAEAKRLLEEAGLADGFSLNISVNAASTSSQKDLMFLAAAMWEKLGVRTTVTVLEEQRFMDLRKNGRLACYTASWSADFNDPDNFIFTFFGSVENSRSRSLCYPDKSVINRVDNARFISQEDYRLKEYAELEKIIVQDDAAWIPLFSRIRCYVLSERMDDFSTSWNGWYESCYPSMSMKGAD